MKKKGNKRQDPGSHLKLDQKTVSKENRKTKVSGSKNMQRKVKMDQSNQISRT